MTRLRLIIAFGALVGCAVKPPALTGNDAGTKGVTECNGPSSRTPMRLLTRAEYDNTLRDVLGDTSHPSRDFPREPLAQGWDNDGNLNQVTDESVTRYLEAAESVAASTVATRPERLYQCDTKNADCAAQFVSTVGRRLFRRPLSAEESRTFNAFFSSVARTENFDTAIEWTLQVLLQAPQFLYRFEEGQTPTSSDWRTPLDGYELATRLSYLLWASTPDDALLDVAASGTLADAQVLSAQAARLLADPKAAGGTTRFFELWLRLDDISGLEKSTTVYPAFTPALAAAWRTSLDLFIADVLTHEGTLGALLTSNALFVNDTMSMYSAPQQTSTTFRKIMMSSQQRSGLLTQPGFLARLSGPDQSSPIRRGIFVLDKLMCQPPPPPPADANITPPSVVTGGTTRQRFEQHSQSASCRGCHRVIDPLGFGFEHYDGVGAFRDTDNGQRVDATGQIVVAREEALVGPFNGAPELMAKLAASRQVHDCVSQEWLRFAMGRSLGDGDACSLQHVQEQFMQSGGSFEALVLAIIGSDTFRTRPVETP